MRGTGLLSWFICSFLFFFFFLHQKGPKCQTGRDRQVKEQQNWTLMLVTKVQNPKKQEIKRQAKGKSEAKTKPKGQIRNTGSAQGPNRGTTRLTLKYTCANDLMKLRWTRKKRGQEHTQRQEVESKTWQKRINFQQEINRGPRQQLQTDKILIYMRIHVKWRLNREQKKNHRQPVKHFNRPPCHK